jgi:hypothetical protein
VRELEVHRPREAAHGHVVQVKGGVGEDGDGEEQRGRESQGQGGEVGAAGRAGGGEAEGVWEGEALRRAMLGLHATDVWWGGVERTLRSKVKPEGGSSSMCRAEPG